MPRHFSNRPGNGSFCDGPREKTNADAGKFLPGIN